MIDFLITKPTLHIFTAGRFKIDFRDNELHFSFDLSDEEMQKLKEKINEQANGRNDALLHCGNDLING